jgi:hypothetical protein
VERIVLKALAKRPEDRFATAEEMSAALCSAMSEADIEPSARISMPRSFTTVEAPAEAVVVASGSARGEIANAAFAADETDAALGQHLDAERATRHTLGGAAVDAGTPARDNPSPLLATADTWVSGLTSGVSRLLPGISRFLTAERRGNVARAILSGLGVIAAYNVIAVWIDGLTGWWALLGRGWPLELIAVALGLCVIIYATKVVWLFIPAGILLGNGLIFAYCQITGRWSHWAFLWPLAPLVIGSSIWLTFRLARQDAAGREMARPLGCAVGVLSGLSAAVAHIFGR